MGASDGGFQIIAGQGHASGLSRRSDRWQSPAVEVERDCARIAGRDIELALRVELPGVARLNRAVEDNFAICGDFHVGCFAGLKLESKHLCGMDRGGWYYGRPNRPGHPKSLSR